MSQQWKKDERDVCRLAGSERTGPVGRMGPDCDKAAPWAIQVKRCPKPTLSRAWLEQAARDQDHRPWVLVQVWYRRGRPRVFLATCALSTLALYSNRGEFGVIVRRHANRPHLAAKDLEVLLRAESQPWLLIQARPDGTQALATLDYRVLCELGRNAGVVPNQQPSREEPQP